MSPIIQTTKTLQKRDHYDQLEHDRARFLRHTRREGECLLWTAKLSRLGYGQFNYQGKVREAHRVGYLLFVGPIPDGKELDHLCRHRSCVDWTHVEPVTHQVNMQRGAHALKTQCPRGHLYTAENTYLYKGRRGCRICILARSVRQRAKGRQQRGEGDNANHTNR